MTTAQFSTIAVVGAGTMGAGIAQLAAANGCEVLLFDLSADALEQAMTKMMASLDKLVARGKFTADEVSALRQRIALVTDLSALAGADIVIEAIVEDLAIKRKLFAELETLVSQDTVLASNTSSLSISALAQGMAQPERFVGMHFFNPAPVMKLVEVVAGIDSEPSRIAAVKELAASWGKVAVVAKSTPGFIVNRVARPYYAEALRLTEEGFGEPAKIDAVLTACGGFRMGPFTLMDLIGHDVNYAVTSSVHQAFYGDSWFTPSLVQKDLVDAGHLGRKTGKGFFSYGDGSAFAVDPKAFCHRPGDAAIGLVQLSEHEGALAPLFTRIRAAYPSADTCHGEELPAIQLDHQLGIVFADGRTAAQLQDSTSNVHRAVMVVDLAADYSATSWLHLACSSAVTAADRDLAAGFFAALGVSVIYGADSPGLTVLRTVAMLANLGFDAVHKGVCTMKDVDEAMRFGVNYPKGPIQWAKDVGLDHIRATLGHIKAAYQDDRYRQSLLLSAAGEHLCASR